MSMSSGIFSGGWNFNPLHLASAAIRDKYAALSGAPGAKVGDVERIEGTGGFVQRYEGSAIFWRQGGLAVGSGGNAAYWVLGGIYARYVELGGAGSYLGLPITDELAWADPDTSRPGAISHFERGAIGWTADDSKTVEFPARRVFRSGHIGVSSVGGWSELVLTSAGTFHFRGHLHNSGFVGLYCTVGAAIAIPGTDKAVAAQYEANVGGTTSVDSRDEDWDESGHNQEIRDNWNALAAATQISTTIDATLGGWEVVTLVLLPAVGAVVLIALVSGPPADTACSFEGSHMVTDGNNRTLVEHDGVRCRRP